MDACWYKQGYALLQQISQTDFGESVVSLWYIGQMGVIVKWRGMVLCIDPVLGAMPGADGRDRRSYPAPFRARELKADFIFCTHDHADHMHPETLAGLAQANPGLTIVVPRPLVEKAGGFGIPANQLRGARQGQKLSLGKEIAVTPVATAHENYEFDAEGNSRTLGYTQPCAGQKIPQPDSQLIKESKKEAEVPGLCLCPQRATGQQCTLKTEVANGGHPGGLQYGDKPAAQQRSSRRHPAQTGRFGLQRVCNQPQPEPKAQGVGADQGNDLVYRHQICAPQNRLICRLTSCR